MDHLFFAELLYNSGIISIPVNMPSKVPSSGFEWRKFAESAPDMSRFIHTWNLYSREGGGIAVPCGAIEMLEADVKNDPNRDIQKRLYAAVKAQMPADVFEKLYIQQSPSGGIHFWYRVSEGEQRGNTVLAKAVYSDAQRFEMGLDDSHPGTGVIVETRGLGGYALIAPTEGYKEIQGSLISIPTLTIEERELLFMIGRSFNEYEDTAVVQTPAGYEPNPNGQRPGDIYNREIGPIGLLQLLESHGWRRLRQIGDSVFLNRPGAKHANKHDGKVNMRLNCFVNYSSSVPDFQPMKGYSPYYVYAFLNHRGDFAETTRALASKGFESQERKDAYMASKNGAVPVSAPASTEWVDELAAYQPESIVDKLNALRFSLADRPKMTYTLFVKSDGKNVGIGFPGAIIAIYGPAKSRKTTVLGAIISAALAGRRVLDFTFNTDGKILWIDTEQGDLYFYETIRRLHIQARLRTDDKERLFAYKFVDMTYQERLENTQALIDELKPSVIVLDGIVDYIRNFNDETESLAIIGRMRKWAATGAMIFPVLHENPPNGKSGGGGKARGHLGTMLTNKCDSAISVMSLGDDKSAVLVKHSFSRGPSFKSFKLTAGKFGILQGETGNPDYDYSIGEAVDVQDVPENTPVVFGGNPEKPDTFEDIPF